MFLKRHIRIGPTSSSRYDPGRFVWPARYARSEESHFSPGSVRQIATSHPRAADSRPAFDTRRPRIRFHLEAAPLGRGVACDAAGRAGSLRGPRRVFLCALPTEPNNRSKRQRLFNRHFTLTPRLGPFIKEFETRLPEAGRGSGPVCGPSIQRIFLLGVRPHECQIGSGD
jgi:hypothetical protein